jgi:hypothetical protein
MMGIKKCIDKNAWDSFVKSSAQGHIFCETRFLNSMLDEYELIIKEENGIILLGAIVLRNKEEVINAPYPFTLYQGILCYNEVQNMTFHKRANWLLENITDFLFYLETVYNKISFCLSHSFEDLRAFQWFHYHEPQLGKISLDLKYTGILNLDAITDFDHYLSMVRTVRRQEYHKAFRDGFSIESSKDIKILNELHKMTFDRQNITRLDKEEQLLLSISDSAIQNDYGELLVCRDINGVAASASLFLYDKTYAYYLFGANNPEFRKSGAGTLLLMENIKRCIEKSVNRVDFVGINSPNRGDYKTSYNSRPVPYFIINWNKLQ